MMRAPTYVTPDLIAAILSVVTARAASMATPRPTPPERPAREPGAPDADVQQASARGWE